MTLSSFVRVAAPSSASTSSVPASAPAVPSFLRRWGGPEWSSPAPEAPSFSLRGVRSVPPPSASLPALLGSLPAASASAPVVLSRVWIEGAYVWALCSDGSRRRCRPGVAASALGVPLTADRILAKLAERTGTSVRFVAANGWSADEWFVAVVAAD